MPGSKKKVSMVGIVGQAQGRYYSLRNGNRFLYRPGDYIRREVWSQLYPNDLDAIRRERDLYRQNRDLTRTVQSLQGNAQPTVQLASVSAAVPPVIAVPPVQPQRDQNTAVSQVTTNTHSIMGGRNEQAHQRRSAGQVTTTRSLQSTISHTWSEPAALTVGVNECDSNADTCCLGQNFIVLHATYRTADVYSYDSSATPTHNVPIVTGATAYDDPISGTTKILVFHESLYYGTKLDHSLINPNQIRSYGIPLWDNPFDDRQPTQIEVQPDLKIPLTPQGTKLLFKTRVPTSQELADCEHIDMTSPKEWNPSTIQMSLHEVQSHSPWRIPLSTTNGYPRHAYQDSTTDAAFLNDISTSLVDIPSKLQVSSVATDPLLDIGLLIQVATIVLLPGKSLRTSSLVLSVLNELFVLQHNAASDLPFSQ